MTVMYSHTVSSLLLRPFSPSLALPRSFVAAVTIQRLAKPRSPEPVEREGEGGYTPSPSSAPPLPLSSAFCQIVGANFVWDV